LAFGARSTPLIRTLASMKPGSACSAARYCCACRSVPAERFVAHAAAVGEQRGDVSRRRRLDGSAFSGRQRDAQRIEDLKCQLRLGVDDAGQRRARRHGSCDSAGHNVGNLRGDLQITAGKLSHLPDDQSSRANQASDARRRCAVDDSGARESQLPKHRVDAEPLDDGET
jgi:hypothetical protein